MIFLVLLFNFAQAGSPKSTYHMDDMDRFEYCAKTADGFFHEGAVGETLWNAFIYGQDKYNPYIWMLRGNNDRFYSLKEKRRQYPGKFDRCFLTNSLPVASESSNCKETFAADLMHNYCFIQTPKSKKDFLKPGVDVPATFISAFANDAINTNNKLSYLNDITKESIRLWQDLLTCSGNDAEAARVDFISNHSACPELNDRMSILKTNFYNALLQNDYSENVFTDNRILFDFFSATYHRADFDSVEQDEYYTQATKSQNLSPLVHPLISQMALNLLVKIYLTDSSRSVFNRDLINDKLSKEYKNLYFNLVDIISYVSANSGRPLGLYPNAGWAAWSFMRERVLMAKYRLSPEYQRALDEYKKFKDKHALKRRHELFYMIFNPNYGVVTSNIRAVNLPEIYFTHGEDILKEFNKVDPVFTNIKIQEDKK